MLVILTLQIQLSPTKSESEKEKFNLSDYVEFIEDFSKSLELDDFHLVGHSVGGCIALLYTLKFPHRTKKLVLISSMCLGKEIALWIRFLSGSAFRKSLGEIAISFFKAIKFIRRSLGFYNPQSNYNLSFLRIVDHPCLVFFIEYLQPKLTPYNVQENCAIFMDR